jgi:hypothetical protein
MLRGLNQNHNHDLKAIFKRAALEASSGSGPFYDFYEALLTKGRKPSMARLTVPACKKDDAAASRRILYPNLSR